MRLKNLLMTLFLAGCSHADKNAGMADIQKSQDKLVAEFEKANTLLDNQKFEEAYQIYDQLELTNPTNQLDLLISFNSGLAHYLNKECEVAETKFRRVVRQGKDKLPDLVGRSLLRLGDVYACLGDDDKSIVNLLELSRGKYSLPAEVALAEVPAKLAASYARIGNQKVAERYFRAAEKGLLRIQNNYQSIEQKRVILAKTLFLMGDIKQLNVSRMSSEDYFSTLTAMQKYLFKAVEFNQKDWSQKAFDQIVGAYEDVWALVDRVNHDSLLAEGEETSNDPHIIELKLNQKRINIAQDALIAIKKLYHERIPDPEEPEMVAQLISKMKGMELKIRNYIASRLSGTSLTPEALEASGLKRAGRILNPDPLLERETLRKQNARPQRNNKPQPKPAE